MNNKRFQLNAGSGMALGILIAVFISLLVSLITGNDDIWIWSIPVGMATGLAIGSGRSSRQEKSQ